MHRLVAAEGAAAEVHVETGLLDQVEESEQVQARIGSTLEVENSRGMLRVGRTDEMRTPLHIRGDAAQTGVRKPPEDRLPMARIGSEVLDFRSEDVS